MVLASRGFAPLRTLSGGIGAGRRRLNLPAPSSSAHHQNVVSAPPAQSPSFIAAPTNPSDRRHRPLPSSLPSQDATSIVRSPICGLVLSGVGVPSFGISAHRLMSTTSAAARYFEGPWYEKYLMLEEYKKKHGNCFVPQSYAIGDVKLGSWVDWQRQLYKKGKLSANRREMLDAIGFSWDPHADKWERNFSSLKQYKKREGHCNVPTEHEEDGIKLGLWVASQRARRERLDESYQRRLENLGMSWDPLGDQWERAFALLEQYKEKEGHSNVPALHEEDGVKLGTWVNTQRTLYKRGKLDESYQQRLENLGMSWDPIADKWERNFALLEQFEEREGHIDVPRDHEEDEVQLGDWISRQRTLYKKGKIDESYQRRLENLGMSWDPLADQWERTFVLLQQYKEREGNCNVIESHEEDGVKLGMWLARQRQLYKKGKIDESYQQRLENLGLTWDPLADKWERNFALLEQFEEREGHIDVIDSHEEDGVNLGMWLGRQRQLYKKGKMDESYQRRLENLGMSWDPLGDQWERTFVLLEQYKEREGNCNVPTEHEEDGIKLGLWVTNQRARRERAETLSLDRIERLEKLGMSWDPLAFQWEHNFGLLQQYKEREGHVNVSIDHVEDGVKLGIWINTQRNAYKKGKIDESYEQRLENLGMSWGFLADQWERTFVLFQQYKEREDHCNVPQGHEEDGVQLGAWLNRQRQLYKKGKLDESYQHRLEKLGVSWDPHTEQWERNFILLEQYKEREGHCNVPNSHEEDGVKLGIWLKSLRQVRKGRQGILGAVRIERLDNLGIRW